MNENRIITDFNIYADKTAVLTAIGCFADNPSYEIFSNEFDNIIDDAYTLIHPIAVLGFGTLTEQSQTNDYPCGTQIIYAVISIGDEIQKRSADEFDKGNYICGMMINAIADTVVFSLDKQVAEHIKALCLSQNIGISARLEAPHDIPPQIHAEACTALNLTENSGINVTSGYMFNPVKTSCTVFVTDENPNIFNVCHDCGNCPNTECTFRSKS